METHRDGMRQKTLAIRSRAEGGTRQWERHTWAQGPRQRNGGDREVEREAWRQREGGILVQWGLRLP